MFTSITRPLAVITCLTLAGLTGACAPPSADVAEGAGAQADNLGAQPAGATSAATYALVGLTIYGEHGPVAEGLAVDFAMGEFRASALIGSDGNYTLRLPVSGVGTMTVYYGVLPDRGPDPIEVTGPLFASSNFMTFKVQLVFDADGVPSLKQM